MVNHLLRVLRVGDGALFHGRRSLAANGISFLLFGFYTVYSSLFLSLGKAKEGFILGACRQGICFVPVILLLPSLWESKKPPLAVFFDPRGSRRMDMPACPSGSLLPGINGILYAQPAADVISAMITVFMAVRLHRELNGARP